MASKYKNLLKDTFVFALGSIGSKLILFFLVPLYTNYLTTSEYGTVELINTIGNLVVPIVSLVIFDSVLRFALEKKENCPSVILNAYIIFFTGSFITLALTPVFGLYPEMEKWKWFISVYIILYMANQINMTYIKAKENSKLFVMLGVSQTFLMAILNILLLTVFHFKIYGYLLANIIAQFTITIVAVIKGHVLSDLRKAKFNKSLFKDMLKYSTPLILNNISWWVVQSSDKIMISFFLSSAALGLYSVASKIPALINVITSIFSQSWGISSIKEYDSTQDTKFYSNVFQLYVFVVFVVCSFLLLIIKPFMKIYVGQDFFIAWKFIPLLLVAASFSAVSAYFGAVYGALKKSVNNMLSTLFSAVFNIGLNFIFIQKFGVLGATFATAVSYTFIALYRMYDTRRYFKFYINLKRLYFEYVIVIIESLFIILDNLFGYIWAMIIFIIMLVLNIKNIKLILIKIKNMISGFRK